MNKEKLIPDLRFPEFKNEGEWEITTIGKLGSFYYGKSAPKWSLAEDAPTLCVRYGELYTKFDTIISEIKSRTNIDPSDLKFSKGGEILVPRVGERATDFAKNCCYLPFPNIAIGEMISVFETKEFPIFYTYYFRTLWREFAEVVEGQNVKNLYYVNLEPIKIGKTSYSEQQKIAICLSSLDEVIAAHRQKLDLLKDHKKGLMQNLFPQEGEKVPKYRFKEFEKDGEWVEKTLNEITPLIFDGTHQTPKYTENGVPFFSVENLISGKKNKFISKEDHIIATSKNKPEKFDILLTRIGNIGFPKVIDWDYDFSIYVTLAVIKKSQEFNSYFLQSFLQSDFYQKEIKSKSLLNATPCKINMDELRKTKILLPPDKEQKEQKKIASCFSFLDSLITAQSEKIEQLKLHKKGLMQGLFPKIND